MESSKNKKIIAGIIIAILIVLFAIIVWVFFLKKGPETSSPNNNSPFGTPGSQTNNGGSLVQNLNDNSGFSPPPAVPFSNTNRLNRISESPIAGATILGAGTSTRVRYMEKATGHIYEVAVFNGERKRITNTTNPKIVEAVWGSQGSFVISRFLENGIIKSMAGTISSSTASSTGDASGDLINRDLIFNIQSINFSPSKKSSFYTTISQTGIQGFLGDNTLEKPVFAWSFPTTEWIVEWPSEDIITLTTKASHTEPGHLLFFNPTKKTSKEILSNVPGLTTKTNPDGSLVLYSASKDGLSSIFLYEIASRTSLDLEIKTLPEKCAWAGNSIYCGVPKNGLEGKIPDVWYQGVSSFSDSLWKLTRMIDGVEKKEEIDLSGEAKGAIDMIDLQLSSDNKTLIFTNKKDSFLWALSLN